MLLDVLIDIVMRIKNILVIGDQKVNKITINCLIGNKYM